MDPVIGAALIGAGSSFSGGVMGAIAGDIASDKAWNRQKAMMQRKYQWQMQDMRKAGLNPILAAGASPGMLTPPVQDTSSIASSARDAVSSGMKAAMLKKQIKQLDLQNDKLKEDVGVARVQQMSMAAALDESLARSQGQWISNIAELGALQILQRNRGGWEANVLSPGRSQMGKDVEYSIEALMRAGRTFNPFSRWLGGRDD
jgi:hypothetical protein